MKKSDNSRRPACETLAPGMCHMSYMCHMSNPAPHHRPNCPTTLRFCFFCLPFLGSNPSRNQSIVENPYKSQVCLSACVCRCGFFRNRIPAVKQSLLEGPVPDLAMSAICSRSSHMMPALATIPSFPCNLLKFKSAKHLNAMLGAISTASSCSVTPTVPFLRLRPPPSAADPSRFAAVSYPLPTALEVQASWLS